MDAVVAVNVMRVLFFCVACLYAERVRGCYSDNNADVGAG